MMNKPLRAVVLTQVTLTKGLLAARQRVNRETTLPIERDQMVKTGRLDAFKLTGDPVPHHFWDSDLAKWIEAVAYSLATHPDTELESLADAVIADIAAAQHDDGYLNIYYTVVAPDQRWTNLRDMHELYCAGHLMEAAVAYHRATGKRVLLDVLARYADYIGQVFGPAKGQKRGYPGHEEIELGLVKLYQETGERRYLDLAAFFVDERGAKPHYYDLEAQARGEEPDAYRWEGYGYNQSHLPVREQDTAEGHSVRAMYLYAGMADVAAETSDATLVAACQRLWDNVTQRRMYITGGIGSSSHGEQFTYDYDLRNDLAYTETCAAIGLVFWAQRMALLTCDAKYVDVMERALYNGVLSGVSLDGQRFFYGNPLTVEPVDHAGRIDLYRKPAVSPERQEWFGCACCPPNIARLLASIGGYLCSTSDTCLYVNLYTASQVQADVADTRILLTQATDYPWSGDIRINVDPDADAEWTLALRIPSWARSHVCEVNGQPVEAEPTDGYLHLSRSWSPGDVVTLWLPMPVERMEAHPAVTADAGKVALQRGPVVYCLEQVDNGAHLADISLPSSADISHRWEAELLGGVVTLQTTGLRRDMAGWDKALYRRASTTRIETPLLFVPYATWGNRGLGEMRVWFNKA